MKKRTECAHKKYATRISAKHAAQEAGLKGQGREVEQCDNCGKYRIKPGLV